MRQLKVVNVDAQFPELKGGSCNQRGRGQGSTLRVAFARAFGDLLRQKKLRRKRFSTLTAIISVGTIAVEEQSEGTANENRLEKH